MDKLFDIFLSRWLDKGQVFNSSILVSIIEVKLRKNLILEKIGLHTIL